MTPRTFSDGLDVDARLTRVTITALMTFGMGYSTVLQFALGALAPQLIDDLGLSRLEFGGLTTAFYLTAAVSSPAAGAVADRLGGRRALALLFLIDAVAFAGVALTPGYGSLVLLVAVAGLAVGLGAPATNLIVAAARWRPGSVGRVVGIKQSGVQIASMLSGLALVPIAALAGWRTAMAVVGALATMGLIACVWLPADAVRSEPRRLVDPIAATTRRLLPYAFLMGLGMSAVTSYLVLYADESVGLSRSATGALVGLLGATGIVSRIAWGHWADRRDALVRPLGAMALMAVGGVTLIAGASSIGGWVLWIAAVTMGASAAGWTGVAMLAVMRDAGAGRAGRDAGYVLGSFYGGLLAMPLVFGALVDASGSYLISWALTGTCFAAARMSLGVRSLRG